MGLFCFISICKFFSFKNPFARITSLSELCFRFRRFILLAQTSKQKKNFYELWQEQKIAENHGDQWGFTRYLQWGICKSIPTWTSSSRSAKFKDILPWNISQMITKTAPMSMRIFISSAMKQDILLWWVWQKVNGNWNDKMIRIPQWRENHCRTNTNIKRKK